MTVQVVVDTALYLVATVLLASVVAALWRAARGPDLHDRLTAFVLLGTSGAALLAVLGSVTGVAALRDAAISVVALATVVTVVAVRRPGASAEDPPPGGGTT